jgi:hypothetical protein
MRDHHSPVHLPDLYTAVRRAARQDADFLASTMSAALAGTTRFGSSLGDIQTVVDRARRFKADGGRFFGMNGQFTRATILLTLMKQLHVDAFIETGTFRGFTCLFVLCHTSMPVLSCEINTRNHHFAKTFLEPFGPRLTLYADDSRTFIAHMMTQSQITTPFFYLDAHSDGIDLPLDDELAHVLGQHRRQRFLLAIDDFKIPWDAGFSYDVYSQRAIDLDYIRPLIKASGTAMATWLPAYPASCESGHTSGFCLLAPATMAGEIEEMIPSHLLRRVDG